MVTVTTVIIVPLFSVLLVVLTVIQSAGTFNCDAAYAVIAAVNWLYSVVFSMSAVLFRFCMLIVVVTVVGCGAAVVVVAASVVETTPVVPAVVAVSTELIEESGAGVDKAVPVVMLPILAAPEVDVIAAPVAVVAPAAEVVKPAAEVSTVSIDESCGGVVVVVVVGPGSAVTVLPLVAVGCVPVSV